MRLIGNKTKLLPVIEQALGRRGIAGGTFVDIFSGTSSVGRYFKERGFRVISNDRMASCYAQAVARVEVSSWPRFETFRKRFARKLASKLFRRTFELRSGFDVAEDHPSRALHEVVHFLNHFLDPCEGIISRSFCPSGPAQRMYFHDENGRHIDAVLGLLRSSLRDEILSRSEYYLLLASLLDAADRVANISGTYGAYLKTWQSSSEAQLRLSPIRVIESELDHRAHRRDANELIGEIEGDVLYIDPPYNSRQYPANYHVLEVIAEYAELDDPEGYEASLYGKTGLRPYAAERSPYCVSPGRARPPRGDARAAMQHLITAANVDHILVSYNEEGIIERDDFVEILSEFSGRAASVVRADFEAISYRRFRSDRDRESLDGRGGRSYRRLSGRRRDEIEEWLFYASRKPRRASSPYPSGARARESLDP